ncbi:Site-specific recombinase XerD [Caldanaerobius fijiensis DSM 17918]|uniref:Site-specific recombinase XerD n=1 Tax=Caldanaerobius fijiensis DSM 17918 TaxID=1121256 RepID=A0A1M4YDH2_9THEO|nr:tyrosine recombinase XerC [Caldanaerobius fijiensis]SHF03678.1 Site-specific recombinase XerD [Caldanaerobius fijiensis DSM 17918]
MQYPNVLNDFLNYLSTIRAKSPNTVQAYFYDLQLFLRYMLWYKKYNSSNSIDIESIDVNEVDYDFLKTITLSDLYAFLSYVTNKRNNSARARARKVASLRAYFKYLVNKAHVLDNDPTRELESPKISQRQPVYLTLDESKELLNSVEGPYKERDKAILTIFLNCGLRLSELVGINLEDIKDDTLTVIGKGDKQRTVYLNNACIKALKEYMKVRPQDGVKDKNALFLSRNKRRISAKTVQYIVKKYIKAAGLNTKKYSTHKLRHTAATLMYKYGDVDIRTLQHLLGHANISTTQIYTHIDDKKIRDAVNKNPLSNG